MKMTILSPGPLSTVQDGGRKGHMSSGFTRNGAMDFNSMVLANVLVGNEVDAPVIETTFLGITAKFDCDSVIAITGADCNSQINGEKIENYKAYGVHDGDVLKMNGTISGMRSYIAVASGFSLNKVMNSCSTDLKCKLGGINGEKLKAFDELIINRSVRLIKGYERKLPQSSNYSNEITVRVVLGPQDDYFTKKGLKTFLSASYSVSNKSDRMGVRLDGMGIESINGVDIISDGITAGSIQVPPSKTPIIMMADSQTTGGYAKIATVITVDLPLIAQARPNTKIRFQKVSYRKAVKLLKKRNLYYKKIQLKLNGKI